MHRFYLLLLAFLPQIAAAQSPPTLFVEHFTNTLCGICASRNPGLYQNIRQRTDVIYMSIYPSAPYPQCVLHRDNPLPSNERTQWYGVFGGTPRVAVGGGVLAPGANYASPTIFDAYSQANPTAQFRINTQQFLVQGNQLLVKGVIYNDGYSAQDELVLFGAIVEDTVFYQAPNGENRHYNVYRAPLFAQQGLSITNVPAIGDSMLWEVTVAIPGNFNNSERLRVVAAIQSVTTKKVYQAHITSGYSVLSPVGIAQKAAGGPKIVLFPNPALDVLHVQSTDSKSKWIQYRIYDLTGRSIQEGRWTASSTVQSLNVSSLPKGLFVIELVDEFQKSVMLKFQKTSR